MRTSAALDHGQESDLVDDAQARLFRSRDRSCRSGLCVSDDKYRYSGNYLAEDLPARSFDDVFYVCARHAVQVPCERDAVSRQWTCRTRSFPRSGGIGDRDAERATEIFDGIVRPTGGVDDRADTVEAKDAPWSIPVACSLDHDGSNALPGTMHRYRPDSARTSTACIIYGADMVAEFDRRWPGAIGRVHQPQDHYVLHGIGHWRSSFGGPDEPTASAVTPDRATGSRRHSGGIVAQRSSLSRSMAGHGPAPQVAARTGALRDVRTRLTVGLRPGFGRAGLSVRPVSAPSCPDLKPDTGPTGAAGCHGRRAPFPFLPAAHRSRSRCPAARAGRLSPDGPARRGEIARRSG